MAVGKDPRETHKRISLLKSAIRLLGCLALFVFSGLGLFETGVLLLGIGLVFGEVLGILEEQ